MKTTLGIAFICLIVGLTACTPRDIPAESDGMVHIIYEESDKAFANPERGFYTASDYFSATAAPVSAVKIKVNRTQNKTLFYTGYYLTDYMESDIDPEYLELIRKNMQAFRDGGAKCILRFAYKTDMYETGHPWDASPEWVHRHIEQLKPIMQEYGDVILCLQAGFIGVWGEWAYTDHFVSGPSTPEEFSLRKDVVMALLDAMPKYRQVAVRTARYKMNMFLESFADSVTIETAYNESDISRICAHNDCFGADGSDMGTFAKKGERDFWKRESKYLIMGGETCQVSNYCKCERSLKDMTDYHWTYLNSGYNSNVLGRWKTDGCYDEVERRLGYRLSLTEVSHTATPKAGEDFNVTIKIINTGFAAPVNPRAVELVLIDGNGNETTYSLEDVDPRYWFAGETVIIDKVITIPADISGSCRLYLNLPDPEQTLHDNPLFSIRLANDGIWNEERGYNRIAKFTL